MGIGGTLWARAPGETAFFQVSTYSGGTIKSVAMDQYDYQRLYVIDDTDVYRSLDAGHTWTLCTGNLLAQVADVPGYHLGQVLVYRREPADIIEAVLVRAFAGKVVLDWAWVLGTDGNLWLEQGPFGTVPPSRQHIDGNVAAFQPIDLNDVLVLGSNGNLWLEHGPFGVVPPSRQQVDGNVRLPTA